METYLQLKKKHEKQLNAFPQFFAFSDDQLEEGLKKLGVTKDKILSTGYGGFIRKSDRQSYIRQSANRIIELHNCLKNEVFFEEALSYELSNHEFNITYDETDALNSLGLSLAKLTPKQNEILERVTGKYLD